jgi:hypothetical protein
VLSLVVGAALAGAPAALAAPPAMLAAASGAPASPVPVTRPQRLIAIGFTAGEPSGGTVRMISPTHPTRAWEMGLGWSMAGDNGLDFHAQHQWHLATVTGSEKGATTFYLGAGGRVKQVDGTRIGVRGALGFNYLAGRKPRSWEAYFELAPVLDLTPDNDAWLNAIIGVRWFVPGGTGR